MIIFILLSFFVGLGAADLTTLSGDEGPGNSAVEAQTSYSLRLSAVANLNAPSDEDGEGSSAEKAKLLCEQPLNVECSDQKTQAQALFHKSAAKKEEKKATPENIRGQMAGGLGDVGVVLSAGVFAYALYCFYAFGAADAAYVAAYYFGVFALIALN